MVALDTESRSYRSGEVETQEWRVGCSIRWRTDLVSRDHAEARVFDTPRDLWQWVSDYCRQGTRTVVWAHNLSHDVRISQALTLLPAFGFELEWSNLDQSVSSMTWRSDHGTLVMADTYTWVPLPLGTMAPLVNLTKFDMPGGNHDDELWATYCMRDAQIVYRVVSELVTYIRENHLGNWQPTGAGMAYATWRHKYMPDKILVHDDSAALDAERMAMYTGRAEAWKHGKYSGPVWTEIDMRNAYVTIGAECELPRKLHMRVGKLQRKQYNHFASTYRCLCRCRVRTDVPVLPYREGTKTLWPVGTFDGWYWDTEIDCALRYGADIEIREAYLYVKAPVLKNWAEWILGIIQDRNSDVPPIVRTWLKHCSRALIGRLALRTKSWEYWAENPEGITGITHITDLATNTTRRLMHVGDQTLIETDVGESENSVPMITGWIMSECRVRLWEAMNAAGLANLAHVDTDSILANAAGLAALQRSAGAAWASHWAAKGSWATIDVRAPRHYYRGHERVIAGIPRAAAQAADGSFTGERWASMATDLESRGDGVVTTWQDTWTAKNVDPRRADSTGIDGETVAYEVGASSVSSMSEAARLAAGE
jgi:hypothetical protein